jgi:hypothetical protein
MCHELRADAGRSCARVDHQRPQQGTAAAQLHTDEPHGRLRLASGEEVLQMRLGQIFSWESGAPQECDCSGERWMGADGYFRHPTASRRRPRLAHFPNCCGRTWSAIRGATAAVLGEIAHESIHHTEVGCVDELPAVALPSDEARPLQVLQVEREG